MSLLSVRATDLTALLIIGSFLSSLPAPSQAYWRERTVRFEDASPKAAPGLILAQATPSATYTYDGAGRTATVLYTDQTCAAHQYDAQGNRVATAVTKADVPESNIWGSGVWGCAPWHP